METTTEKTYTSIIDASLKAATDVRFWPDDIPVGSGGDQGDLLMWRIDPKELDGMEEVFCVTQLAPGTSQGSRHTIGDPKCWRVFKPKNFGQFINTGGRSKPTGHIQGYALLCLDRDRITHPEHAPHSIGSGCAIQTAGQTDARTLQWAKD